MYLNKHPCCGRMIDSESVSIGPRSSVIQISHHKSPKCCTRAIIIIRCTIRTSVRSIPIRLVVIPSLPRGDWTTARRINYGQPSFIIRPPRKYSTGTSSDSHYSVCFLLKVTWNISIQRLGSHWRSIDVDINWCFTFTFKTKVHGTFKIILYKRIFRIFPNCSPSLFTLL